MARRWTAAEDRLLLDLYAAGEPRDAIAVRLGRTPDAVDARRRTLRRPARTITPRRWTEAEDAFLRAATAAGVPSGEIASRLYRTAHAVRRRREVTGLTGPRARPYTARENEVIAAMLRKGEPLATIAGVLGRSEDALRLHARQLGLVTVTRRRRWTVAEDQELRRAYVAGLSTSQIRNLRLPTRSEGAIAARAHLLGLAEHGRRWNSDDDATLARLVEHGLSSTDIARRLGRTEEAVAKRCRVRKLRTPSPDPPRRRGPWRPDEDEQLRAHAGAPVALLVSTLGRSHASIRRRRRFLRLEALGRTLHHPLKSGAPVHAQARAVADETPLTPARALTLARRLDMPLREIWRLSRSNGTSPVDSAADDGAAPARSPRRRRLVYARGRAGHALAVARGDSAPSPLARLDGPVRDPRQ